MEQILYSVAQYKILSAFIAFFLTAIESFIPILPLVGIVLANSMIFGMWLGFFISWAGSCIASILLYYCARKISKLKIFDKYRNRQKNEKLTEFIKKQGFSMIFITYVCPFISDFLITIVSGLVKFDMKTFVSGMVCGKFVMFLFISYVGEDIEGFFRNPLKIILFTMFILSSWIIGKKINNKMHVEDNL